MKQRNIDANSLQFVCIKTNFSLQTSNFDYRGHMFICFIATEAKNWYANMLNYMPVV